MPRERDPVFATGSGQLRQAGPAESEERFRLLVEGVRDYAIFMLDPDGYIVSWNSGAEYIKGYRAEEIIGKHFSVFYTEEAIAIEWPQRELAGATRAGRFEDEGWRIRKDGTRFWANVVITALRDETGALRGFAKITRDLTERMRAESALRESQHRYRRLFEAAREGVLIVDAATGRIIDANPFMAELRGGGASDDLLDRQLWEIGLFPDADAALDMLRRVAAEGYLRYDPIRMLREDGGTVEVELVCSIYSVDHTQVIQCHVRDVTERQELERTRIAAEALLELNRRKDEFLAMLSHELRNPIGPIQNAVLLLGLEAAESPVQHQARVIIQRQVTQLSRLVDDLMEAARISSGKVRLQVRPIDLRETVASVVESVQPLIDRWKHRLEVRQPETPVWVRADPIRIEQVLFNLLSNAAKYTPSGGRIRLRLAAEGADAVLQVTDNGTGIHPDLLPDVFDIFTQGERPLDRSPGGLGIGLTLVRRLVELHHGTVEVRSSAEEGSEFTVRLRLVEAPAESERLPEPSRRAEPARGLRIMVVDDNPDQADSMALLLRDAAEVGVSYSARDALERAEEFRPHVVLMDIGLPDLDGYEAARLFRKHPTLGRTVLIAVTGYGQPGDRERALSAGFDDHLVKPIDLDKLRSFLASLPRRTS